MSDTSAYDKPSTPSPSYVAAAPDVKLIRDLLAGTRRMHEFFKDYIPKYNSERPQNYKRRGTAAKVYGGLARTLSAAVGMLFAKKPKQEGTWTGEIGDQWQNLDGQGTGGDIFVKQAARDAMADGFTGILVDFPPAPTNVEVHSGNEVALGLRPYWASYPRADVISWRTTKIRSVETLSQVVLREGGSTNVGAFGSQPVVRYRVCRLVVAPDPAAAEAPAQLIATWSLLEERMDASGKQMTLVEIEKGVFRDRSGAPFQRIPFAIPYAGHADEMLCAQPPLLDVAWANLEHWRVATNLRHYEDQCCFPQPTVKGALAKDANGAEIPLVLGPTTIVRLSNDAEFTMTELTGSSLAQLRASLAEKKDEIGELGMSFLVRKTRGVETAEAKRLDATAENASLATAAQLIQDGLNQALIFHAQYLGIEASAAPSLSLNTDFEMLAMDAATMLAYVTAVKDAGLPVRILLESWQLQGRIAPDEDLEALEAEMVANAAAAEAQRQLEAKLNAPPIPAAA